MIAAPGVAPRDSWRLEAPQRLDGLETRNSKISPDGSWVSTVAYPHNSTGSMIVILRSREESGHAISENRPKTKTLQTDAIKLTSGHMMRDGATA